MTVQMTVRIPDDLAAFVDAQVTAGTAPSRAVAVAEALRHERRRQEQQREIAILIATEPDPESMAIAEWASKNVPPIDDDFDLSADW